MTEVLHFKVEGEFITNLARERFYQDHNLSGAIELVQSATVTDELTEVQHLMLALEVIAGKKSIVGTYPGDDYGVEENKDTDCCFDDFIKEIDNMQTQVKKKEAELQKMYRKYSFVLDHLPDMKLSFLDDDYYDQYGERLFESSENELHHNSTMCRQMTTELQEFIDRRRDTEKHKYSDYGWLEPDGTYHEVEWCRHSEWAMEYLNEHYPYREHHALYWKVDAQGKRHHYVNGDVLVYCLGWVLLDNPMQGIATPKYDPARGMTKAQKEFLFDYYIERGMNDRASRIYKEED